MNKTNVCKHDAFVSVIMTAKELQPAGIEHLIRTMYEYLENNFFDYEIIIVEDAPNTINYSEINSLLRTVPSLRFLEISYAIPHEIAITAGLEAGIGDYTIIFNPCQDPLEAILSMVDMCRNDKKDIIVGVAQNIHKSIGYRIIRPFVNFILDEIGYHIPQNATTLRCLSRTAVSAATKARNYHHQIFVRIAQSGLRSYPFEYNVRNISSNKKRLYTSVKHTLNLVIFNSTKPLRWMSILGAAGSFLALLFSGYSFIIHFISNNIVEGWSSIVILISLLFMLLFIILSFFGEYLGRLLNDQSNHEPYLIVNEHHSSVMVDTNRHNVLEKSTIE